MAAEARGAYVSEVFQSVAGRDMIYVVPFVASAVTLTKYFLPPPNRLATIYGVCIALNTGIFAGLTLTK
eukprot:Awhi_evm1s13599